MYQIRDKINFTSNEILLQYPSSTTRVISEILSYIDQTMDVLLTLTLHDDLRKTLSVNISIQQQAS